MKNREGQIGRDNVIKLMRGEFDFNPKRVLNKTLIFDITKINEKIIMGKIIDNKKIMLNFMLSIQLVQIILPGNKKMEDKKFLKSKKYIY